MGPGAQHILVQVIDYACGQNYAMNSNKLCVGTATASDLLVLRNLVTFGILDPELVLNYCIVLEALGNREIKATAPTPMHNGLRSQGEDAHSCPNSSSRTSIKSGHDSFNSHDGELLFGNVSH